MPTARLIVFISGSGSNLQAILDSIADATLPAEVILVVSNRRSAFGLVRAQQAGIATLYAPFHATSGISRETYDATLADQINLYQPDLLVLAGWMHIFSPSFLVYFPNRVINLHPALPSTFPGIGAIQRAYEAYRRGEIDHSGCMVHYAIPEVDAGPIIVQEVVSFEQNDTLETFEARMHATEHRLIVEALRTIICDMSR